MSKPIRQYQTRGIVRMPAIKQAVDDAWALATTKNKKARQILNIPVGQPVPASLKKAPYRVKKNAGAAVESAVVLIYLGHEAVRLGSKVARDAWDAIVFPYLKRKFGLHLKTGATVKKEVKTTKRKAVKKKP